MVCVCERESVCMRVCVHMCVCVCVCVCGARARDTQSTHAVSLNGKRLFLAVTVSVHSAKFTDQKREVFVHCVCMCVDVPVEKANVHSAWRARAPHENTG